MTTTFTQIINGEIPCYKVYENDKTFAFLDIHPETPGHVLVIPKIEVDKVYELPDDYYYALMETARKLSKHMESKLGARILWKVVGTDVPHAHIHLEPHDPTWYYGRIIDTPPEKFRDMRRLLEYKDPTPPADKTDPFAPPTSNTIEEEDMQ